MPFSAPRYRGPKTDHFDGRRFFNHESTGHQDFSKVLRWGLTRKAGAWPDFVDSPFGAPPPPRVEGDDLRVTFIGHATVLVQTAGLNILTDPVYGARTSPVQWAGPRRVRNPGIRFEDLPPIDVVLLSHNHYDHLCEPTMRRLAQSHQPHVFTGLGNKALVERYGIERCTELDWWDDSPAAGDVNVTCVPMRHFSGRGTGDRDATLWCGLVVETPGGRVLFAGDTGWGRHFAAIRERLGPMRLSLLPIGAFRPEWFMAPVHVSPDEAVRAHAVLESQTSVAIHYGTFKLADDAFEEPVTRLQKALAASDDVSEADFWLLPEGEGRMVPSRSNAMAAE